jgi:hypothetical protein
MVEMKRLRLVQLAVFTAALAFAGGGVALATPITYTEQAVASGTLGATPFSDANLTIQWTGDTSSVGLPGSFLADLSYFYNIAGRSAVDLTISGVGSTTFTDGVEVFVDPTLPTPVAGFAEPDPAGALGILGTFDSAFGSYGLTTPIGPITDNVSFSFLSAASPFGLTWDTGLGGLTLTAVGVDSTFAAITTSPVPEPASLALFGTGVLTFVGRRLRRARD